MVAAPKGTPLLLRNNLAGKFAGSTLHVGYRGFALHGNICGLVVGRNSTHRMESSSKECALTLYPAAKCHYGYAKALCRSQHSRWSLAM